MDISYLSKSNENINKTYLPDWYEVDFVVPQKGHKYLLQLIAELLNNLKINLISKWFFLYESNSNNNSVIRLRYSTKRPEEVKKEIDQFKSINNLQISAVHEELFDNYYENKKEFPNKEVLTAFANIMYEISKLTIRKLKNPNIFSNFVLVERISHCAYNNVYGIPAEAYYLFKRLKFNFSYEDKKEDPEHTILDDNSELLPLEYNNLGFKINVPFKKQKR